MLLRIFAIRDSKAEAFLVPFFARTRGEGERMFSMALSDDKQRFVASPEDYTLYELGSWDDDNGILVPLPSGPVVMGPAVAFMRKEA